MKVGGVGGVGGVGSFGAVEAFGRLRGKDETSVMWRKRRTFGPLKERRLWLEIVVEEGEIDDERV